MWAQLVKARTKTNSMSALEEIGRRWEEEVGRGTDSGWVRTLTLQNATDPAEVYQLVYFESEEKARANERGAKHQELVEEMSSLMEGPPEYVDLTPIDESTR